MIEEDIDQLTYERLRFNQLELAHQSTLMVYSKNREIVKKLRPEFLRCFIANEIKDCTRLINKYNSIPGESGIDIILIDADMTGIKILDLINKRPFAELTSKLSVIYSVMLLPLNADNILKENIELTGGPNQLLTLPCSSKDILYNILDILWRGKIVEKSFRNLTQSVQRAKFAYIPIFKSDHDDEESVTVVQSNDNVEDNALDTYIDPNDYHAHDTIEVKTDNVDDWTNSSSLEANWIKSMRHHESGKLNLDDSSIEEGRDNLIYKRHEIDKNIAKELNAVIGRSSSSTASNDTIEVQKLPQNRKTIAAPKNRIPSESCRKLLDPTKRPNFNFNGKDSIEIKPFFDRQLPDIKKMHTVGGLDKIKAQNMWKIVTSGSKIHSQLDSDSDSVRAENNEESKKEIHRADDLHDSHNDKLHDDYDAMEALNRNLKEVNKAQKTLRHMAKHAPEDFLVHEIIPMSLHERKLNLTENEFYLEGLRLEAEGEFEKAISVYKKVGVHSKEPQVSKIFLALLLYRQKKFMNSLVFLNIAIEMIQYIEPGLYNKYDEFIALYNRGVINFRVGNDEQGLQDLHQATQLYPDHIKAAEVYSIALRRLQKFRHAIDVTIQKQKKLEKNQESNEGVAIEDNNGNILSSDKNFSRAGSLDVFDGPIIDMNNSGKSIRRQISNDEFSTKPVGNLNTNDAIKNYSLPNQGKKVISVEVPNHVELKIVDKFPVSLKQRIYLAEMKSRELEHGASSKNEAGKSSESLPVFRKMVGYKNDLFESIFVKPSELQEALAVRPQYRSIDDQLAITTLLKVSPFFRDLSETALNELALSVEYRLIAEDTKIFIQDCPIDAMILVLKGRVEAYMEGISSSETKVIIGEAKELEPCGHIDMLFQNEDSSIFNDFLNIVNPKHDHEEEKNDKSKLRHRCFQPNIFASYEIDAMSEILLIPRNLFDRIIASNMIEEMKKRLDIIVASRIFSDWNKYDIIRLARMGQVRSYKSGDIILEQATKPSYLYLIMKGMCKAYKKPHRGEIYLRHLNVLKAKAERHDLKYTYHHKMRHVLSKPHNVNLKHKQKNVNSNINIHSSHLTDTEYNRYLLAQEIHKYEILLQKAQIEDAKNHCDDSTVSTITPSEENQSEVATLQWPMLFGEVSVLEPEAGVSQGTIVADTACDVFLIHKIQMQTFHVDENVLEKIKIRSVKYPNDVDLTGIIEQKKEWKKYRASCLSEIKTTKWPGHRLLEGGTTEPFGN